MKNLGQYFTPEFVARFMVRLITKPKSARILEPCAGKGVFLRELVSEGFKNVTAYEIDGSLPNESQHPIIYQDFLSTVGAETYDVIIGNPPYVRWKNIPRELKRRFRSQPYWTDKMNGLTDLLFAFMYTCVDRLKPGGELIFITPMFWTESLHATRLRRLLSQLGDIELFITFNEMRIFEQVSTAIMIFKFVKAKQDRPVRVVRVWSKDALTKKVIDRVENLLGRIEEEAYIREGYYEAFLHQRFFGGQSWKAIPPTARPIISAIEESCRKNAPEVEVRMGHHQVKVPLSRLLTQEDLEEQEIAMERWVPVTFSGKKHYAPLGSWLTLDKFAPRERIQPVDGEGVRYVRLGDVAHIANGLVSGLDRAFRLPEKIHLKSSEEACLLPVIKAHHLRQYYATGPTSYIFLNRIDSENELRENYPNLFAHVSKFRQYLENRYDYAKDIPWWHWVFLRNWELIHASSEKILVPCKERIDIRDYARFAYVKGRFYATQDVTVIVKRPEFRESPKYLVALLNSRAILTWLKHKGFTRGGVLEFSERPLASIPVRLIDWNDNSEVGLHDSIVGLVDDIISDRSPEPRNEEIETFLGKLINIEHSKFADVRCAL